MRSFSRIGVGPIEEIVDRNLLQELGAGYIEISQDGDVKISNSSGTKLIKREEIVRKNILRNAKKQVFSGAPSVDKSQFCMYVIDKVLGEERLYIAQAEGKFSSKSEKGNYIFEEVLFYKEK